MTLWTVTRQAPLSMGFSRQEYWNGLPFPSAGNLHNPGIKHRSLKSPALQVDFYCSATRKAHKLLQTTDIYTHTTVIYRTDKQQGPTYSMGHYVPHHGKDSFKKKVYICMTKSLCSATEVGTTSPINDTSIKSLN